MDSSTDGATPAAVAGIRDVLGRYRNGDTTARLEPAGDELDAIRTATNELGTALTERAVDDGAFKALLSQLTAIASLDFGHRIPTTEGPDHYRALALGLNMLTEELEAALRSRAEAEAQHRHAFVSAPIGMVMADAAGEFTAVNPAFAAMLGGTVSDFIGRNWRDITHPDDVAGNDHLAGELLSGRSPLIEIEKRYVKLDGETIWGRVSVTVVGDNEGKFRHTLAQIVDITERRRADAALREARDRALESDRLKTEFLRNISHEIRTPMTSILGMTDLALATELNDQQREFLEIVSTAGRALLHLVDDLLHVSRIEAGRTEPNLEAVAVRDAIEEIVAPLRVQAERAGLRLRVTVAADLPAIVVTDRGWLTQILTNLVGNAVKFTTQGAIDVLARRDANHVTVAVADTGVGVSQDRLEVIFDPFVQADGSVSRRYGGTGLGLAISRRLAELLGGSLTAVSTLGRGSTFTVRLPLRRYNPGFLPRADERGTQRSERAAAKAARRALVADDNADNRLLMTRVLEADGFAVVAVEDGRKALAALERERFDVVLMDIQMPDLDGLQAITAIRATAGRASTIPVVAVTAHASEADRRMVLHAGADGFVTKPFTAVGLLDAVAAVLGDAA